MRIGLRNHQESKNREENSSCHQKDFWRALKRVLSCWMAKRRTGRLTSLGEVSSVDTTSSRVDTLGLEHCVDTSMGCVDTTLEEIMYSLVEGRIVKSHESLKSQADTLHFELWDLP
ncbi:hypothetical protein Taro_051369 [Colocasia esculenta]|uniref:Uncharacterized protein n=1 Tax=Colocasia esculenta TaxID=4460 RepID=A0A843XFX1_COLES|nr:hypothetical protein [Colocasia esculenta]